MLKRDSKGRFIKPKQEEVQTIEEQKKAKNHVKEPKLVTMVPCGVCRLAYLENRTPLMQVKVLIPAEALLKRGKRRSAKKFRIEQKAGIYFCKDHFKQGINKIHEGAI
jgi:hypothetical protein